MYGLKCRESIGKEIVLTIWAHKIHIKQGTKAKSTGYFLPFSNNKTYSLYSVGFCCIRLLLV